MVKNLSIGAILAIVIITSLIVSVATVSITGNVIKVKKTLYGTEVYTKEEVQGKLLILGQSLSKLDKTIQLTSTLNSSTVGTGNDRARFMLLSTGDTIDTVWYQEGKGNIVVGGVTYDVTMVGDSNLVSGQRAVTVSGQLGYVGDFFILQ